MSRQVQIPRKDFSAKLTSESLLSGVNGHVAGQIQFVRERFLTHFARERFQLQVRVLHVSDKAALVGKRLVAQLADEFRFRPTRIVRRVHVVHQLCGPFERLFTNHARKLFQIEMYGFLVVVEIGFGTEALLAYLARGRVLSQVHALLVPLSLRLLHEAETTQAAAKQLSSLQIVNVQFVVCKVTFRPELLRTNDASVRSVVQMHKA